MKVPVYSTEGQVVKEIDLPEFIFGQEINKDLIYRSVTVYLANQRQGTAFAKGRSDVKASGRKPWRQKNLGRARAGSASSPVWIGGGKAFGPKPRDFSKKLPKKMKRKALFSALSLKLKEEKIKVVEDFSFEKPKTKQMVNLLKNLNFNNEKCLLVMPENNENIYKSGRNIPTLDMILARLINTYTILKSEYLVITPSALKVLEEVFKDV